MNIKPSDRVPVHVGASSSLREILAASLTQIKKLARVSDLVVAGSLDVPKASARAVLTGGGEIAIPLEGLIEFDKERERLRNQVAKLEIELGRISGQLSNPNFVDRAPAEKVQELRDRKEEIEQQIMTLNANLEALA